MVQEFDSYATKIEMLDEIIEIGVGVLDFDDILSRIMESASKVFDYDSAAIREFDPNWRVLSPMASSNGMPDSVVKPYFDMDGVGFVINMSRRDSLTDLLDTAVREVPALLGAEHCSIFLFDSEGEKLFLRASNSPALKSEIGKAYCDEKKSGLTWHMAKTGEIVMLPDARKSPYWRERYHETEPDNYLGCPLKDGSGKVYGVIRFIRREDFVFAERDKTLG